MRFPRYAICPFFLLALVTFFVIPVSNAQVLHRTEAELDGLAGPVRSVSTTVARSSVRWRQPGGPELLVPVLCADCSYDPEGYKTKAGQIVDGAFAGEITRLVRDGNGQVIDRFVLFAANGQLTRHDIMGAFGPTDRTTYANGKPDWHQTYSYDQLGNMTEELSFDSSGKSQGRSQMSSEPDATLKERSVWGADGQLSYQQTFDPETHVEHFTTFDHGKVKLTWTVVAGKLVSFWELPGPGRQFGDGFIEPADNDDKDNYECHADGKCDVSRVHYEYLDQKNRNPQSAEWRDAEGKLEYAVYYDYEIDSFRNWTSRRVWVWSRELGARKLYETDAREITYWQE